MIARDQTADVRPVDGTNPLLAGSGERQRRVVALGTVLAVSKQAIDHGQQTLATGARRYAGVTGVLYGVLQEQMPILVLVEDREVGAQSDVAAVLAQHVSGEAMERRQASAAHARTEETGHSAPHLLGRLGREREREDSEAFVGGLLDEPRHACRQHKRLAGPRPGEHQHRAAVPVHGPPLVDVQGVEIEHGHAPASAEALVRILDSSAGTGVSPVVIRVAASAATSGLLQVLGSAFRTSVQ